MTTDPTPPWTLSASSFNWLPDILRAERSTQDLAVGIVTAGLSDTIELEVGQAWRSFPHPAADEVDRFRDALTQAGGRVSMIGASLDDARPDGSRLAEEERFAFLLPQVHAAHRVGASGLRLPIGQAGLPLLQRLVPILEELDLVLYEEIQGQQVPEVSASAAAIQTIVDLDEPTVRVLVDVSMFMPALPPSYLAVVRRGGLNPRLVDALTTDWREPSTHEAVIGALRSGEVPPPIHTLFMNLLVRFGRAPVEAIRPILPVVGAYHLKFWDLDDGDDRVSAPIRDLSALLRETGFSGTLCSEWGGHEWIENEDATDITRRHLALARAALAG